MIIAYKAIEKKLSQEEMLFLDPFTRKIFAWRIRKLHFGSEMMEKVKRECIETLKVKEEYTPNELLDAVFYESSIIPKMIVLYDNLPRIERIKICFLSGKWKYIKNELNKRY